MQWIKSRFRLSSIFSEQFMAKECALSTPKTLELLSDEMQEPLDCRCWFKPISQ